jgi:hypothetical protein
MADSHLECYHKNPARIRWAGNLDRKTHPGEKDSHKLEKAWNDGELIDGLQHEKVDKLSLPLITAAAWEQTDLQGSDMITMV